MDLSIPYATVAELFFTCELCKEDYKNPKILSCFHTFCEDCLLTNNPAQSLALTCPICNRLTILPLEGVARLNDNQLIKHMMSRLQSCSRQSDGCVQQSTSCTSADQLHANVICKDSPELCPLTSDLEREPEVQLCELEEALASCHFTSLMTCHNHIGQNFTHFCTSCDTLVCDECIEEEHFDQEHRVTSIERLSENCQKDLHAKADIIQNRCALLDEWEININETTNELLRSRDVAIDAAREAFKTLESELHRSQNEALQEIEAQFSAKKSVLDQQKIRLADIMQKMRLSSEAVETTMKPRNNIGHGTAITLSNSKEECNEDTKIANSSSFSGAAADGIRTYLLHKHISERLNHLSNFGTARKDSERLSLPSHCNSISSKNKCQNEKTHLAEQYSFPNENSFLKWEKLPGHQSCLEFLKSYKIGRLITNRAVGQMSILSGQCLHDDVTCAMGHETHVTLTTKDYTGCIETCSNLDVQASLTFCDVIHKNGDVTMPTNDVKNSKLGSQRRSNSIISGSIPVDDLSSHSSARSDDAETSLPCRIVSNCKGSVEIHFTPPYSGKYLLSVKLHGRHVVNSPCNIFASAAKSSSRRISGENPPKKSLLLKTHGVKQKAMKRPQSAGQTPISIEDDLLLKIGSRGRKLGEFFNPQDVAVDSSGRIYVTDSNNQCIQMFQMNIKKTRAKCVERFGQKGRGIGQVHRPTGVALLPSGDLAVSDYENKVVNIFSSDGAYKSRIGAGKLMGPRGVCVDQNDHLVVVDNKQCQIFIFQLNGKLVTRFGSRGTEPHQLAGPHYAAVNQKNEIFVTDFYNHCVKVFTTTGSYVRSFGSRGEGCGQFNAPTGLCVDQHDHVVVADWGNSRVQIFDDNGSFLAYVNAKQEPLYGPQGVATAQKGVIAVADSGNQCVKVYKILH